MATLALTRPSLTTSGRARPEIAPSPIDTLGRRARRAIARVADRVSVPAGATIDHGSALSLQVIVVTAGRATATRRDGTVVALEPGDAFGAHAVTTGRAHGSRLVADEHTEVVVVGLREYRLLAARHEGFGRAMLAADRA